jgi:tetratricopeptide (TPR) repeat protein
VHLGSVLRAQGKNAEAETDLREALALQRKLLPAEHPDIASSLDDLGLALLNYAEAERCHREALLMRRRLYGPDHPAVADSLAALAYSLERQGKYVEAETNFMEALKIERSILGEHRDTAITLDQLGALLLRQNRLSEAEQMFREALAIYRKVFGESRANPDKLVDVLLRQGKIEEAVKLSPASSVSSDAALLQRATVLVRAVGKIKQDDQYTDEVRTRLAEEYHDQIQRILSLLSTNPPDASSNNTSLKTARALQSFAAVAQKNGELEAAAGAFGLAARRYEKEVAAMPDDLRLCGELNGSYEGQFTALSRLGRPQEYLDVVHDAIRAMDEALVHLPQPAVLQRQAHNYRYLGFHLRDLKDNAAARQAFLTSSDFFRRSLKISTARDKGTATALEGQADNARLIGDLWSAESNQVEAQKAYGEALEFHEQIENARLAQYLAPGWRDDHYVYMATLLQTGCSDELALKISRALKSSEVKLSVTGLNGLANCYCALETLLWNRGYRDEAKEQLARLKELLPAGDPQLAGLDKATLGNLAGFLTQQGKGPEAVALFRRAAESGNMEAQYQLGRMYANGYGVPKDETEAIKWLGKAGVQHHLPAIAALNALLRPQGRLSEVETIFRNEVEARKKRLGDDHPDVAFSLKLLGDRLCEESKFAEAEKLFREALATQRHTLGAGNHLVVVTLDALTEALAQQGKMEEVVDLSRKELERCRQSRGTEHADVGWRSSLLAGLLWRQGNLVEAESRYREALRILKRQLLPGHPFIQSLIGWIGDLMLAQGKLAETKALVREAEDTMNTSLLNGLAWSLATCVDRELRDGQEALRYAEKAVTRTGRTNSMYLDTLAAAYAADGQFTNAVNVQKEAIALLTTDKEREDYTLRLKLYVDGIPYRDTGSLATHVRALLKEGKFAGAEPLAHFQRPQYAGRQSARAEETRRGRAAAGLGI